MTCRRFWPDTDTCSTSSAGGSHARCTPRPLQFVWQRRAMPALTMGFVSPPHRLWILRKAFGETVVKTPRFWTHTLLRTQPAVGLLSSRRLVIIECAARIAIRTQRLDSRPRRIAALGICDPQNAPRFLPTVPNRLVFHQASEKTLWFSIRSRKALVSPPSRLVRCVWPFWAECCRCV